MNPTYPLHIYSGGTERYRFDTDGTAYADVSWSTFSPYISMHFIEGEKEDYEIGELVVIDEDKKVSKTSQPYQNTLLGVVAEKAGFISYPHNWKEEMKEDNLELDEFPGIPVAYLGDVPVKVSLEGGEIAIGDPITSSSQEGIAMRATEPGRMIGIALESFDGTTTQCESTEVIENEETGETETIEECQTIESEIGKIMVLVNPHWSLGSLTEDGSLAESDDSQETTGESESTFTDDSAEKPTILDQFTLAIKKSLEKLGLFIESGIAKVKQLFAEKVRTEKLEMVDQVTGEIYCTWIENGEWIKVRGECGDSISISGNTGDTGGDTGDDTGDAGDTGDDTGGTGDAGDVGDNLGGDMGGSDTNENGSDANGDGTDSQGDTGSNEGSDIGGSDIDGSGTSDADSDAGSGATDVGNVGNGDTGGDAAGGDTSGPTQGGGSDLTF